MSVYVNKGNSAYGTGAISVPVPASYTAGNVFFLCVSTANQSVTTPSGWTLIGTEGVGTAGSAGGVRITVFWKIVTSSESSVSIADSGSYTYGIIFQFSNINNTSPYWSYTTSSLDFASADLRLYINGGMTASEDSEMILAVAAIDYDADQTGQSSNYSIGGSGASGLSVKHDEIVSSGSGGGIIAATVNLSTSASYLSFIEADLNGYQAQATITIGLKNAVLGKKINNGVVTKHNNTTISKYNGN